MWKLERDILCFLLVATLAVATFVSADDPAQDLDIQKRLSRPRRNGGVIKDDRVAPADQQILVCDPEVVIGPCGNNGRCAEDPTTHKFVCMCKINFFRETSDGECVQRPTTTVPPRPETTTNKLNSTSGSSGSSVAVGLLIPTFLIVLGVLGFCAARRYGLLPCRRNLYGNVLVTRDDDDDDPPIA